MGNHRGWPLSVCSIECSAMISASSKCGAISSSVQIGNVTRTPALLVEGRQNDLWRLTRCHSGSSEMLCMRWMHSRQWRIAPAQYAEYWQIYRLKMMQDCQHVKAH